MRYGKRKTTYLFIGLVLYEVIVVLIAGFYYSDKGLSIQPLSKLEAIKTGKATYEEKEPRAVSIPFSLPTRPVVRPTLAPKGALRRSPVPISKNPPPQNFEIAKPTAIPTEPETKSATESNSASTAQWSGMASYYSRSGCVGCSANFTMANGQPLDDSAHTLAFNYAPIGSTVRVVNQSTGASIIAKVTDTGGFNGLGRIADLTIGTRDAIGCSNLCPVRVELL